MLKQRTINLEQDEILIIKAPSQPEERAEIRLLTDDMERFHVFVTPRPFAILHSNRNEDQINEILSPRPFTNFQEDQSSEILPPLPL